MSLRAIRLAMRSTRWPGGTRHRHARNDQRQLVRRCGGVSPFAGVRAVADPGGRRGDLHRSRRAVRKLDPSGDDHFDVALGRHRRAGGADDLRHRSVAGGAGRDRAADGHRQEERHHDGGLRARRATQSGRVAARRDPRGVPAALPADHDDDDGGVAWRLAAGSGARRRVRTALPAWRDDRRRFAAVAVPDAVHHTGDLPGV